MKTDTLHHMNDGSSLGAENGNHVAEQRDVPDSWWKAACERIHHPIACVDQSDWFKWVNSAYERLVGYSMAELLSMRWQDITVAEDIGADQRNVQAVLSGWDQTYTMAKRYRHKAGQVIPIILTVWRHHSQHNGTTWLIAEAMPEHVTSEQFAVINAKMTAEMKAFQQRLAVVERQQMKRGNNHNSGTNTHVNVGDKNSDKAIRWLVVAVIALASLVMYVSYVATWPSHRGEAEPPKTITPNHVIHD